VRLLARDDHGTRRPTPTAATPIDTDDTGHDHTDMNTNHDARRRSGGQGR
jgi:hypothetical protein